MSVKIQWLCAAALEQIDGICAEVAALCAQKNLFTQDRFAIELLLRESLTNAVVHGSEQDPAKIIDCRLQISETEAVIEVYDQGQGFDWHSRLAEKFRDEESEHGRGLDLYGLYATSMHFNTAGNGVVLRRILRKGVHMSENQVLQQGDSVVYIPGNDLVASGIPAVRGELKQLIEQGAKLLVVDLSNVRIIDSSGIGCLVAAHNTLKKKSGRLEVRQASAEIFELFHSMRLDRHFTVLETQG